MALQLADGAPALPQADAAVAPGGRDELAVGADGDGEDAVAVAAERPVEGDGVDLGVAPRGGPADADEIGCTPRGREAVQVERQGVLAGADQVDLHEVHAGAPELPLVRAVGVADRTGRLVLRPEEV